MIKPENGVLELALGKNYARFTELVKEINERNLILEWHYYNDGKSWLGKILHKKKNMCWLSVWNTGFRLTFYFTEKTIHGIQELDIDDGIKKIAQESKPIGKLVPLPFLVGTKKRMNGGLRIIDYKIKCT